MIQLAAIGRLEVGRFVARDVRLLYFFRHDNLLIKVVRLLDVDLERSQILKSVAKFVRLLDVLTSNNQLPVRPDCGMS